MLNPWYWGSLSLPEYPLLFSRPRILKVPVGAGFRLLYNIDRGVF